MATNNFPASLAAVLKWEGGNDDDPVDRGGRTSRGITQREYNAWRIEHGLVGRDVWTASDAEVKQIYHDEYWMPEADGMAAGVDYLFFDLKVTSGPNRAIVTLQRALGVGDDGRIGPITRTALAAADPATLVHNYCEVKRQYYRDIVKSNPKQIKFLKGWINRANDSEKIAIKMLT
jgi:lysozyme family protein